MIFAVLSVVAAGVLEIYRKHDISLNQTIFDKDYNASSISIFTQIPQFTLMGTSEVFTSVSGNSYILAFMDSKNLSTN